MNTRMDRQVFCVLLNWNGWRDTLKCLEALQHIDYAGLTTVVVDNNSTDDSIDRIRNAFPFVHIIENVENGGYSAGNNLGIKWAMEKGAEYVWLLNNDTVPAPSALRELMNKAATDDRLGAVGSVLFHADRPYAVQAWGGGKVHFWRAWADHAVTPFPDAWFDYLTAASLLVRVAALRDIGLLDEGFFLYWEDTDFSFRLRSGGWLIGVAPESKLLHREHGTTGRNVGRMKRYVFASGLRFLLKHAPLPWLVIPFYVTTRFFRRLFSTNPGRVAEVIGGIADFRERQRRFPIERTTGIAPRP